MLLPEIPAHMISDLYTVSFFFLKFKSYQYKMVIILSSSTHLTEYIYALLRQGMIKTEMMGAR